MKFTVTFKDPDGVSNSLDEAVSDSLALDLDAPRDPDEHEAVREIRREKVGDFVGKWIGYGEYLTVEFDTEAGTATVKEDRG